jgi:hypothetical protein
MDKIDFNNYTETLPKPDMDKDVSSSEQFDTDDVWKIVTENLRMILDKIEYKSWFEDMYIEDIRNGTAILSCTSEFKKSTYT